MRDLIMLSMAAALCSLGSAQEDLGANKDCCAPEARTGWCTGQDLDLHKSLFAGSSLPGVVLEMGVPSGCYGSHSKAYEHLLGWSSVLIEADPTRISELKLHRPDAKVEGAAVCADSSKMVSFVEVSNKGLSYIDEFVHHVGGADSRIELLEKFNATVVKRHALRCEPLASILRGLPLIDLFFLDCEGCEESAIKSMNFDHTNVGVINVEGGGPETTIGELLRERGYVFSGKFRDKQDSVWVKKGYKFGDADSVAKARDFFGRSA